MPTQTAYAVHSAKEKAKSSVSDFKRGIVQGQEPDKASVPTSSNSIDRISLISVWNFKRHRKQSRLEEKRTDQRQQELPVPMIDLSPLLLLQRQTQEKHRKSSVLSRPTRYIPSRPRHSLSRSVRLLLVQKRKLLSLYHSHRDSDRP